jgi:hypothetical protein
MQINPLQRNSNFKTFLRFTSQTSDRNEDKIWQLVSLIYAVSSVLI